MIWSDQAIDYSAGFTMQPDGSMKPKKLGTNVMTIEECQAVHSDMCWDGSDWSPKDIQETDKWMEKIQRMLNGN